MKKAIFCLVGIAFSLSLFGCGTINGTVNGMKQDMKTVMKADKWFREHCW